jgi:hypothetical protein
VQKKTGECVLHVLALWPSAFLATLNEAAKETVGHPAQEIGETMSDGAPDPLPEKVPGKGSRRRLEEAARTDHTEAAWGRKAYSFVEAGDLNGEALGYVRQLAPWLFSDSNVNRDGKVRVIGSECLKIAEPVAEQMRDSLPDIFAIFDWQVSELATLSGRLDQHKREPEVMGRKPRDACQDSIGESSSSAPNNLKNSRVRIRFRKDEDVRRCSTAFIAAGWPNSYKAQSLSIVLDLRNNSSEVLKVNFVNHDQRS